MDELIDQLRNDANCLQIIAQGVGKLTPSSCEGIAARLYEAATALSLKDFRCPSRTEAIQHLLRFVTLSSSIRPSDMIAVNTCVNMLAMYLSREQQEKLGFLHSIGAPATGDNILLKTGLKVHFTDDDGNLMIGTVNHWNECTVTVCDEKTGDTYTLNHSGANEPTECWVDKDKVKGLNRESN